jgi:hypothetical protein
MKKFWKGVAARSAFLPAVAAWKVFFISSCFFQADSVMGLLVILLIKSKSIENVFRLWYNTKWKSEIENKQLLQVVKCLFLYK